MHFDRPPWCFAPVAVASQLALFSKSVLATLPELHPAREGAVPSNTDAAMLATSKRLRP
jgi:hypothetical protein